MINDNNMRFSLPPGKRLGLFLCIWVLCYIIGSILMALILSGGITAVRLRLGLIFQDLVLFVVPALVTALMITRRPSDFLMIEKKPGLTPVLLVLLVLVASAPLMNCIISWNQSLTLPESLHSVELWMREAEKSAEANLSLVTGDTTVGGLIIGILIIGVLAGFSEELFFRGTLQRLIQTASINVHVAVWLAAVVFSAAHIQFFGFIPRLLLGAFFGYAAVWSGSLWLAVLGHIFNNSIALTIGWCKLRNLSSGIDLNAVGTTASSSDVAIVIVSLLLTIAGLYLLRRSLKAS